MYRSIYIDTNKDESPTVYVWDDKEGLLTFPWAEFSYAYVVDPKGKYVTMTGKRVSKTRRYNRGAPNVFESDIPRETRVLTDLYLDDDNVSVGNVTMFFDIEVSMKNGIPNIHNPNNEITSIALHDPVLGKYTVLVLDTKRLYENRETDEVNVIFCATERDLLHRFMNVYESINPTIISGWNSDGFDIPYLYNRTLQVCGRETANRLSPIGKVKYSDRMERYKIAGVSCLDYLIMYKKFTFTEQPNYRLDTIARFELKRGKVEYDGSLDSLFEENLEKFIEYNLEDVRLLVDMDNKLKFVELARGICHIGHVPYEDYSMSSRFLEGTIITYLHRKNIIVTDKPKVSEMEVVEQTDTKKGFTGAYVKTPMPAIYDWVYSLDLQSLYPSIIRSLNISPETKVGHVRNFNVQKHLDKSITAYVVEELGNDMTAEMEYDAFINFLEENNLTISSNGVLYTNDKRGIVPEVLEVWFNQRIEFQDLMKKYDEEGNVELYGYYKKRQHIQKIFLNSMYGVLGLPSFRFYDIDNAKAVTISGQDVIKSSADVVNKLYATRDIPKKSRVWLDRYWEILKEDAKAHKRPEPSYPSEDDYCIYIDTDSLYFSAGLFLDKFDTDEEKLEFTIKLAHAIESKLNKYYDGMAKSFFNCSTHQFHIKGETIAKTGIWTGKKRYALDKVYDLEKSKPVVDDPTFKGLDVVRSSFPKIFREFMKPLIMDFLKRTPKSEVDKKILDFKASLKFTADDISDVARNTSVNGVTEYETVDGASMNQFVKGTPINVKSAIVYNRLLEHFGLSEKYEPMRDGEKIKYVLLGNNPLRIKAVAFKGHKDPKAIMNYIVNYVDTNALFENELQNKLEDFYTALSWGNIPTEVNQNLEEFFSF